MVGIIWEYLFSLFDVLILTSFVELILYKKEIKLYLQFILILVVAGLIFGLSYYDIFSYFSALLITLVSIGYIFIIYKGSKYGKIIVGILFQLIYGIYSIVTIYAVNLFSPSFINHLYQYGSLQRTGFIVLTRGFAYIFLLFLINKRKAKRESNFLSNPHIFYILLTCIIILFVITNMLVSGIFSNTKDAHILVLGLILLFFSAVLMEKKLFENKLEMNKLEAKAKTLEMQTIFYETSKMQNSELRRIKHDLKNSFLTMEMLLREKKYSEAMDFINNLTHLPALKKKIITGNTALDALLNVNIQLNPDIQFIIDLQITDLNISNNSIAIIVGNALNNAIEAVKKIERIDDKIINVSIVENSKKIVLKFINKFEIEPKIKNGNLVTTKEMDENHGIGYYSICREVENYNGKVTYEIDKKQKKFCLNILLLK